MLATLGFVLRPASHVRNQPLRSEIVGDELWSDFLERRSAPPGTVVAIDGVYSPSNCALVLALALNDVEELTDLFQFRGSLAISAFHFIFRTNLKSLTPEIIANADQSAGNRVSQIPICARMARAVGNKEMIRTYDNITDKIHFIWKIYSASPRLARLRRL